MWILISPIFFILKVPCSQWLYPLKLIFDHQKYIFKLFTFSFTLFYEYANEACLIFKTFLDSLQF